MPVRSAAYRHGPVSVRPCEHAGIPFRIDGAARLPGGIFPFPVFGRPPGKGTAGFRRRTGAAFLAGDRFPAGRAAGDVRPVRRPQRYSAQYQPFLGGGRYCADYCPVRRRRGRIRPVPPGCCGGGCWRRCCTLPPGPCRPETWGICSRCWGTDGEQFFGAPCG